MALGRFVSPQARAEYEAAYERGLGTLPAITACHDIDTSLGTARVYRFGDDSGVPMVLLHGRASSVVMWEPNLAAFAARRTVYGVDLIGEPGRSEQTAPIRGGEDQATWLGEALDALELREVHLVGYSFGGWLAANLAVRAPYRLASVSLIDPVQTFASFPLNLLARSALTVTPGIRRWARPSFLRWIGDSADIPADDPVITVVNEGMRTYRIALPTPTVFTDDQLRSIDVPVLALIAGRSVMHHGGRAVARARNLLPDVRAELWPSATHAIAGESAQEVSDRVLTYLRDIEQRA